MFRVACTLPRVLAVLYKVVYEPDGFYESESCGVLLLWEANLKSM